MSTGQKSQVYIGMEAFVELVHRRTVVQEGPRVCNLIRSDLRGRIGGINLKKSPLFNY